MRVWGMFNHWEHGQNEELPPSLNRLSLSTHPDGVIDAVHVRSPYHAQFGRTLKELTTWYRQRSYFRIEPVELTRVEACESRKTGKKKTKRRSSFDYNDLRW